jgi:hypothetical protein
MVSRMVTSISTSLRASRLRGWPRRPTGRCGLRCGQRGDDALQLRRLAGRAAQDGGQEDQHRRFHHHIGGVNEHGRQLRTGEAHHAIAPFLQIVEAQVVHRRHAGRHHDRLPVAIRQQECQIHKNPEMQLGQAGA